MGRKSLQQIIGAILVILLLVGCSTPAATTIPPIPTGNLSVGATLTLGSAEVKVVKVAESMATPIEKQPASAGMKFVLVQLNVIKLTDELTTERFVFESASGKKIDQLSVWYDDGLVKSEKMNGYTKVLAVSDSGTPVNVFFEVQKDEDISTLRLSYR